ncbi:cytochrome P450-like protein [Tribolium castaneum]|uniref:Cytochrome P450-like protein n=1 Tax=Tribolium castaneum TaxID=7070 RepID=D6WKD4_TRICA|nr:cytochrome P450-like protein [Tribolium castaneum]
MILPILLCLIFSFLIWSLYQTCKKNSFYKNIPGPSGVPIFGIAFEFKSTQDVLINLTSYIKTYGDIVTAKIGPFRRYLLVSDYNFLECVLSSTKLIKKSHHYTFFQGWLGTGLLTADGAKWKTHRRILTPAFHFQILEQFIEVFEKCGDVLVKKFENEVGRKSFDIYPYVTLHTLDVICESIMGISVNAQNNSTSEYVNSVKNICKIFVERSVSPLQMCRFMYPFTKNYWAEQKALKILHQHTNSVIDARRKELHKAENGHNTNPKKSKKPFLDLLLETKIDGIPLTQEEIREEVDTFMFEGHDTTASAISFTLYSLANNLHVQEKAVDEQKKIFGERKDVTAAYADLQNMKYLENIIKESLRLYPSVPFYNREITDDIMFGQKFAMLEMKSTISKILRKYKLLPADPQHELNLVSELILKSSNGIKISIEPRC